MLLRTRSLSASGLTKTLLLAMGVMLGLATAAPAIAGPILQGTTSNATGITGLVVDGTTYNVTFISDTYANVYGNNAAIFASNSSLAADAAIALTSALNSLNVTILTGNGGGFQSAVIPDSAVSNGAFYGQQVLYNSSWTYYPDSPIGINSTYGHNDIAVFAVPEPASLFLMGAGLAGLGFLRRRKTA
jgi:hypothetical protein